MNSPRIFVYARVSTLEQDASNQIREVEAAGFKIQARRTEQETISGSVQAMERKGFVRLINKLEEGDVLVVTKLDRLGRNAMDVRATVEKLAGEGVRVHCLALGGVDLTSPAGKMTMGVIAAVAELERDLLIERTLSGQARARAQGVRFGRPSSLTPAQLADVASLRAEGESVSALARRFSTSRRTIQRVEAGVA